MRYINQLFTYLLTYSKKSAWIWMKCCVSTDVGTWTIWLTFEPNPDYSPDAGTALLSLISYVLQRGILLRRENPTYRYSTAATRCFTIVFTARCICISAVYVGMQCLSVHLSVTFVSCAKTNKDIFEIFSPCGSHTILVFFHTERAGAIPTGIPLTGASNARGYEKMTIFDEYLAVSETVIVRWVHAARQFVSIEFSFHPYNIQRDCPRGVLRGSQNVVKITIFGLTHWLKHRITRKLFKKSSPFCFSQ